MEFLRGFLKRLELDKEGAHWLVCVIGKTKRLVKLMKLIGQQINLTKPVHLI